MSNLYIEYLHNQYNENTILKFFYSNSPLVSGINLIDFVKYDGGTGKSNIERIYENYDALAKAIHKEFVNSIIKGDKFLLIESEVGNLPLYTRTSLLLPKDATKIELIALGGKNLFLKQKEFNYFFADKLYALLSDPSYVRVENIAKLEGNGLSVEVIMENVQVWIWSRALNKIIDVSPFITNLSIDKSDIGSFSFSLNPIKNLDSFISFNKENVINYFSLNSETSVHNFDFFYKNFQYNDVAFIRFEKLQLEKSQKLNDYIPEINRTQLPDQIWDMIGLIDSNSMNQSFHNTSQETSISGRDLTKLLVEDGSYFMNLALLQGSDQKDLIVGFNKDDKWFKRNIYDGSLGGKFSPYNFPNSARKISDTLSFIINQLSNLGVLGGEDLFASYADEKRTKRYEVSGIESNYLQTMNVDGIWQIIKLMIDKSIDSRRIVDDSLSYVDGTILEQFNKACQKPFVEFFGDTYGNEFNFIVRQPPFTKDMILSFLKGIVDENEERFDKGSYQVIDIEAKDLQGYNNLEWDSTYYSWYQLTPTDSFLGKYSKLAMGSLIPIIYFEEVAECFGNHRLIVPDNYLSSDFTEQSESEKNKNLFKRAYLNDMKYVIDSNIYLPFTRKGSLTLVKGDRRIKKGTFIRVLPTKEIFYVDSVSNSISFSSDKIDRTTTIRVSRGMIEDYIYGGNGYDENGELIMKGGDPVKFSYFNIANTIIEESQRIAEEISETIFDQPKRGLVVVSKITETNRKYVEKYFPANEVENAMRIMQIESSGNPLAVTDPLGKYFAGMPVTKGYEGSKSWGLYQINDKAHPEVDFSRILDPDYNTQQAARIFKEAGNSWDQWSASRVPGVLNDGSQEEPLIVKTVYNVKMGVKDLQAYSKSNPGILRSIVDGSILAFSDPQQGFSSLLVNIENSKLKGENITQFVANILGKSVSGIEKNTATSKTVYLLVAKINKSPRALVSEVDTFKLASSFIDIMTKSTVTQEKEKQKSASNEIQNQTTKTTATITDYGFNFSINKEQFDFFLKRKHLNIYTYGRNR